MKVIYIVSAFPVLTETFVLREIRNIRDLGVDVRIGQLRPLAGPRAHGFDELGPLVIEGWRGRQMLGGAMFVLRRPRALKRLLAALLACAGAPRELWKVAYVILVAAGLAKHLETEQIQHVRAHYLHTEAIAASVLAELLGISYSFTCHTVKAVFPQRLLSVVAKAARPAIADTNEVKAFLVKFGVSSDDIQLLRNGVDLQEFPFKCRGSGSPPRPILLSVGRLDRKKGFHVLLDACARLKSEGVLFRCVIIGDGEQRATLERQRNELGLCADVELKGNLTVSELREWYHRSTILVVPSVVTPQGETDGLPTVVIEAMASGLPVVASNTAALPEIIRDGQTGILSQVNNPGSLARSIIGVLRSSALQDKVSREARRVVEEHYNLVLNATKLLTIVGPERSATAYHNEVPNCRQATSASQLQSSEHLT